MLTEDSEASGQWKTTTLHKQRQEIKAEVQTD